MSCQGESRESESRGLLGHELSVIESDFEDVKRQTLNLWVVHVVLNGETHERIHGGMADSPAQGRQDMPLHLQEHVVVIQRTAHGFQLLDCWDLLFLVTILRGNEEGGAAHELIMALVDHSLGAVAVEKVDCEKQSLGQELKGRVSFHQEIEQIWPHEPLNLGLNINGIDVGYGFNLPTMSVQVRA